MLRQATTNGITGDGISSIIHLVELQTLFLTKINALDKSNFALNQLRTDLFLLYSQFSRKIKKLQTKSIDDILLDDDITKARQIIPLLCLLVTFNEKADSLINENKNFFIILKWQENMAMMFSKVCRTTPLMHLHHTHPIEDTLEKELHDANLLVDYIKLLILFYGSDVDRILNVINRYATLESKLTELLAEAKLPGDIKCAEFDNKWAEHKRILQTDFQLSFLLNAQRNKQVAPPLHASRIKKSAPLTEQTPLLTKPKRTIDDLKQQYPQATTGLLAGIFSGLMLGIAAGAFFGSILPGFGTIIGGVIGGIAGAILGGIGGFGIGYALDVSHARALQECTPDMLSDSDCEGGTHKKLHKSGFRFSAPPQRNIQEVNREEKGIEDSMPDMRAEPAAIFDVIKPKR